LIHTSTTTTVPENAAVRTLPDAALADGDAVLVQETAEQLAEERLA
jgi:hypothetical protein